MSLPCITYRRLYKPDSDMDVYDALPIIPPHNEHKRGANYLYDYHREIAWTIDYQGDNDNVPCLMFAGAGYTLVKTVLLSLFGKGSAVFRGFRLYNDYTIFRRQATVWGRTVVEFKGYDENIMKLEDLGLIIANVMQKTCVCNVTYLKLNKFLNI